MDFIGFTPWLNVKRILPDAKLPSCAHPGSDLAYDLFCAEETTLVPNTPTKVRCGIAVEMYKFGFLIRDRSSMASNGIFVIGGVIDEGYRGEIQVIMVSLNVGCIIEKGQKIAQMIPMPVRTSFLIREVQELPNSTRGEGGFGSTGK